MATSVGIDMLYYLHVSLSKYILKVKCEKGFEFLV